MTCNRNFSTLFHSFFISWLYFVSIRNFTLIHIIFSIIATPGILRFNISMLATFSLLHYDFFSIFGVHSKPRIKKRLNRHFIRHDFSSKFKSRFRKLDHKSKASSFIRNSWNLLDRLLIESMENCVYLSWNHLKRVNPIDELDE